jgi:DNA polymerase delta subunit 1
VRGLELIKKQSLWGYKGDDLVMFLKIIITQPSKLPRVRDESSLEAT